ncbi:MAG: radical SAM protein [Candidatus Omnitrophota bacterium]
MKIMFYYSAFENLGIEYLSAVLKQSGHKTRLLFDPGLFNDPFLSIKPLAKIFNWEKKLLREFTQYNPGLVAFSVTSSTYLAALDFSKKLKKITKIKIVFGGIHASAVPEVVIKDDAVDYLIVGEAEEALLELVEALENNKPINSIKNLWYKDRYKIFNNSLRDYITDLDKLPFPDKDLYYDQIPEYRSGYTIITRRGCPNHCAYCHNSLWHKLYKDYDSEIVRYRGVDNVITELKQAKKKYNFKRVRINDEIFTLNEGWLKEFSAMYKKYINRPMFCFVSPHTVNEKTVECLKAMNCYQVCMGVQTLNEEKNRILLNRNQTNNQVKQAIKLFREYKIRCVVDNIIGLPGEKEEDLLQMARFYNNNRPDRICIFWLIYFPGTKIIDAGLEKEVLNQKMLEEIKTNPQATANTIYSLLHERGKNKYYILLLLIHFLPKNIIDFIIKKRLFELFSLLNPSLIEIPFTMIARDRLDIVRRRYYSRYIKYGIKKLFLVG